MKTNPESGCCDDMARLATIKIIEYINETPHVDLASFKECLVKSLDTKTESTIHPSPTKPRMEPDFVNALLSFVIRASSEGAKEYEVYALPTVARVLGDYSLGLTRFSGDYSCGDS